MLRMIGALRSRNRWDEELSGGRLLIAIVPHLLEGLSLVLSEPRRSFLAGFILKF